MASHWQQAKEFFQNALDLAPDERNPYLQKNCPDPKIRREVVQLLEIHQSESDFLESPIARNVSNGEPAYVSHLEGSQIGEFRLLRSIGIGGMGVVYEADQAQPKRRVAIKLLKPSRLLSRQAMRRFEHEAEILGRLEHPGIAKVFFAGTQDFGEGSQPWFAMELIKGQTLKEFAENQALSLRQKLMLLRQICSAVEHAHTRGIIHRDLKPSNIMIVLEQGDPIPKIVDFGVARVAQQEDALTQQTRSGDLLGTLDYMSPEQVSGDPEDIDPRCDVYALGIIGFELLSGQLPRNFRSSSLAKSLIEVQTGHVRRLDQVARDLRGDLTRIFNKALQPEPGQRYASVQNFSEDIQRYLDRQPILARTPSIWYYSQRFVVRNWLLVATTILVLTALTVGMIGYANQAKRARQAAEESQYEADKAVAVNSFMTNDFMMRLLAQSSQQRKEASQLKTTIELIDHSADKISEMFGDRPSIEAAVRNEVGTVYYNLGAFEQAANQYDQALKLWQDSVGPEHADTLKAVNNLGLTRFHLGDPDAAETLYRRCLEGRMRVLGEANDQTLATMNNLAELLRQTKQTDQAKQMFERALTIEKESLPPDDKTTLTTMANYGALLVQLKELDRARDLHRQVYFQSQQSFGKDSVTALQAGFQYARTLHLAEQYETAQSVLEPQLPTAKKSFGNTHGFVVSSIRLLARTFRDQGKLDRATELLRTLEQQLRDAPEDQTRQLDRIQRDLRRIQRLKQETNDKA